LIQFEKVLIKEMKGIFGEDRKRIAHALNLTKHAYLLLKEESGKII